MNTQDLNVNTSTAPTDGKKSLIKADLDALDLKPGKKNANPGTWVFADDHLQLSDFVHSSLGGQTVQQRTVGNLKAERGLLRISWC